MSAETHNQFDIEAFKSAFEANEVDKVLAFYPEAA